MAYKRRSKAEKIRWVERYNQSGLDARAFCRRHRLPYQGLLKWRRLDPDEGEPAEPAPEFVEFEVSAPRDAVTGCGLAAELEVGGGVVLRVFRSGEGAR